MHNRNFTNAEKWAIGILIVSQFLLHFIVNLIGAYGFFRDELYYIACSEHLSWGYVDQPPLSLFLLKVSRLILGDSLVAIRVFPAMAIAITMWMTALIVKEIGGRLMAIFMAVVAVLVSPIHTAMGSYYSMNSIDIMIWAIVVFIVLRIYQNSKPSLWIWLGIVLGLGLLNKISVLFLGTGLVIGLLVTNRKALTTPWPYIAGIIAGVLFLPFIIWNLQHDLAHLEFIDRASSGKYSGRSAFDFTKDLLLNHNPFAIPIWITGLVAIFLYKPLRQHSVIGWLFLIPFFILVVNRTSKGEYLTPAFVILFSAGAVFLEQKLSRVQWVGYSYGVLLIAINFVFIPFVTPILPVESYVNYAKTMNMEPHSNENKELADLPQFYADMFGWEEKAKDVAAVYNTLSEDDKKKCAVFSDNYGRCGAIDFFGEQYGLPKSIGNHNNYWIWGPKNYTGDLMIILGGDLETQQKYFESSTLVGVSTCKHCMPYENNVNIFLCRGLKMPLPNVWPQLKHYD
jgi:hypothetical protein